MIRGTRWAWFWRTRPYLLWLEICKHAKLIKGLLSLAPPEECALIEEAYSDYKTAHCLHVMADLWGAKMERAEVEDAGD